MSTLSIASYFPFARVKVVGQHVHDHGAEIHLRPDLRWRPICHDCGRPAASVHSSGHQRMVRDLAVADRRVWLRVEYRKLWCSACGKARVEHLSFCDAARRLTHRMRQYVYELCKVMTVAEVARHLDLNPKTVAAIDKEFLQQEHGGCRFENLRVLAIDEIAIRKGQQYMTVVMDYDTGRVVWTGEGHHKATLDRFFGGMTPQQKAGIQAVAIDMWPAYINRVEHHCPQAKIVFDYFHTVQAFGAVVDEVRREQVRQAVGKARSYIKGTRYLLLRNRENLSPDQVGRLDELLRLNATLSAVYQLKEQLKVIYRYQQRPAAKRAFEDWCVMALSVGHPKVDHFVRRIRRREEGILNHCQFPIGTSRLEGANNKIKVIKRKAYGFHDPEYFGLKIKQAFPGKLKEKPPSTNSLG